MQDGRKANIWGRKWEGNIQEKQIYGGSEYMGGTMKYGNKKYRQIIRVLNWLKQT